jgi:type IV secretion system protein VirB10
MSASPTPEVGGLAGDVRPIVRTAVPSNLGLIVFVVVLLLGGLLLFQGLNARRHEALAPETADGDGAIVSAPPALSFPAGWSEAPANGYPRAAGPVAQAPFPSSTPTVITRVIERPSAVVDRPSIAAYVPPPPISPSSSDSLPPPLSAPPSISNVVAEPIPGSAQARRLPNPSFIVPQGTVIAAVLETALDSTRPGAARALVSRDVKSFDGTRVLIPRGSRIYGEYTSDLSIGQKRALVQWHRLTRPDGVILDLDSPATDPLGRAGVRGKVNSHFFERFSTAIVQSILDIGVGLATREATDGVIVALPGSTQNVNPSPPTQIMPTLRVAQGTSVSVFVARDLDFSAVEL